MLRDHGRLFRGYQEMGCGFAEPIYQECREIELRLQALEMLDLVIDLQGRPLTGNPAHGGEYTLELF